MIARQEKKEEGEEMIITEHALSHAALGRLMLFFLPIFGCV